MSHPTRRRQSRQAPGAHEAQPSRFRNGTRPREGRALPKVTRRHAEQSQGPDRSESWAAEQAARVSACGAAREVLPAPHAAQDSTGAPLHAGLCHLPQGHLSDVTDASPRIKDHENSLNLLRFEAPFDSKARPAKYLCRKIPSICHGTF